MRVLHYVFRYHLLATSWDEGVGLHRHLCIGEVLVFLYIERIPYYPKKAIPNYTHAGKVNLPIEIKDEFFEECKGLVMKKIGTASRNKVEATADSTLLQWPKELVTVTNLSTFKEQEYRYPSNQPNAAKQPPVANEQVGFNCKRYRAAVDRVSTNTRLYTSPLPTVIPTKTEVILKVIN